MIVTWEPSDIEAGLRIANEQRSRNFVICKLNTHAGFGLYDEDLHQCLYYESFQTKERMAKHFNEMKFTPYV